MSSLLLLVVLSSLVVPIAVVSSFVVAPTPASSSFSSRTAAAAASSSRSDCCRRKLTFVLANGWKSDFDDDDSDDFLEDDDDADALEFAKIFANRASAAAAAVTPTENRDLSAIQTRQFSLGPDLVLSNYLGNMGFDEVTDWEYYYQDEDDTRRVVQPNPFLDSSSSSSSKSTPKRTRKSSGSVIRLFRGEFTGTLGGTLSAQGLDKRVLVKEVFGDLALRLAECELKSIGRLQTNLLLKNKQDTGDWITAAASRSSVRMRQDSANVATLVRLLRSEPYVGILGEVNLAELDEDDDDENNSNFGNEFYRALGVPPPKSGAIWIVYEYAGLASLQTYASQPPEVRRASLPEAPKTRGLFGNFLAAGPRVPPPLPPFADRAAYVVKGVMKGAIEAVANLHESGLVHRSIGRSSLILTSKTSMDKGRDVSSPYATLGSQKHSLVVKLTDFGFSGPYKESTNDDEFCARARTVGLSFRKGDNTVATTNFAMAEDMHALGFVFLGLLLTSLAELPSSTAPMPAITDEDSLQRLLGDIFDKDFEQFRAYIEAEEDVWSPLVDLLDKNDGAGWTVLETLMLAREKAAKTKDSQQIFTIRGLLANPFFNA